MKTFVKELPKVPAQIEQQVASMSKPELNQYINHRISLIQGGKIEGERLEAIKIEARFAAMKLLNRG